MFWNLSRITPNTGVPCVPEPTRRKDSRATAGIGGNANSIILTAFMPSHVADSRHVVNASHLTIDLIFPTTWYISSVLKWM
jgi:hypothetical protein